MSCAHNYYIMQAQVSTLNAEVQRYKERKNNSEQNLSKLTTELSNLKHVRMYVCVCKVIMSN